MRIPKLCCFIALVYLLCVDVSAQNRVIISKRNFELIVLNSESDTLAIYSAASVLILVIKNVLAIRERQKVSS